MKTVLLIVLTVLTALVSPVVALKETEVVALVRDVLHAVPALSLPPISLQELNLFANATNGRITNLDLSDIAISIPDPTHMQFSLSGMTGQLDMDLTAGMTTWPHLKKTDHVVGKLSDMNIKLDFLVQDGNAAISNAEIVIGNLTVNFGNDALANLLSKLFLPVLKSAVQKLLPPVIVLFGKFLDFQHLMTLVLKGIPKLPLPDTTLTLKGYTLQITDLALKDITDQQQAFNIINGNQFNFDVQGLTVAGSVTLSVGKVGAQLKKVHANLVMTGVKMSVVTTVTTDPSGGLEINYASSALDIASLVLSSDSTDPTVQWLEKMVAPYLQSSLSQAFNFLVKAFFDL